MEFYMKNTVKRLLSMLLALAMVLSILPTGVFAADDDTDQRTEIQVTPMSEADDDPDVAHEHSYQAVVTPPTCTEGGFTTYTCECGESYVADKTAALGHAWDEEKVKTQPVEGSVGVVIYTCARCSEVHAGHVHTTNLIISHGHCGENLTWILTANGVLTISGTGAMKNYGSWDS